MNPNPAESPFCFNEMFFSKTDKKGIILSGNLVFQRVSEFQWKEIISRPHNLIRHPDMPAGVFYLLWEYLKAGKPIGAFVKNKSKTGKHYWVFALAMPVEDGYLSVRIKPGGELLRVVENEYIRLRSREKAENLAPKDSCEALLHRLTELGFQSYSEFMTHALFGQIENRNKQVQVATNPKMTAMREIATVAASIIQTTGKILKAFKASQYVPLNLEIYATKLGKVGSQLSVVANQYLKMADEINKEIINFDSMSKRVIERIETGQFLVGASQLMKDARRFIAEHETDSGSGGATDLTKLSSFYLNSSEEGLNEILDVLTKFKSICESLQMMGAGLELVRVTGKIEVARLSADSDFNGMLLELQKFQTELLGGLRQIMESHNLVNDLAKKLKTAINEESVSSV